MFLSQEELEHSAQLHPEIADYMAKNPRPPVTFGDHINMRKGMDAMDAAYNVWTAAPFTGSETYHDIPMRDGFASKLKIQKPAGDDTPGPLIVLCFGGGFVVGNCEQFTKLGRVLVNIFRATVVSISYRLAPEHKFPIGQYDTHDSIVWIAKNATGTILKSDPKQGFILGGVSAGGALTGAFSRFFQAEPLAHPLTGQWLCIPSLMEPELVPEKYKDRHVSKTQQAKNPFFSSESRKWLLSLVQHDIHSPLRYAINSETPLSDQPKAYFQVDGADPLRDDALIYDDMLKEAGVETKLDHYPGCPHGHFMAFPALEIAKKANIDTIVGFGWLLGKEVSRDEAKTQLGL